MISKKEKAANQLFYLSISICIFLSISLALFLLIDLPIFNKYLHFDKLQYLKWLLPLSLMAEGFSMALKVWHNRQKKYRQISSARFAQAFFTAGLSIYFGWQGQLMSGLIIAFVVGQWVKMLWMLFFFRSYPAIDWNRIKQLAAQYSAFLKYGTLGAGLNNFSQQLPNLMLPHFYGESIVGFFSLAVRVLRTPLGFLGISVGDVFFENASKANLKTDQSLANLTYKTAKNLLIISILFFTVLFPFAPQLFQFVFGEEWYIAGEYARCLLPWTCLAFISNPLSYLFDVKEHLKSQLFYNVLLFTARFGVLFVGGCYLLAKDTIAIYGLVGFVFVAGLLAYLLRLSKE